jgi:hypothetical protein
VLKPLADYLTQPMAKDLRGICISQDPIFQRVFEEKYATGT